MICILSILVCKIMKFFEQFYDKAFDIECCDENGVTIMGSAQAFGNKAMNKKELTKFYNKMGFEGTADNLVRKPKKTTENPLEDILESQIQNKEKDFIVHNQIPDLKAIIKLLYT